MNIRPVLLPALVFPPNIKAREKALKAFRTYKRVFGKQQSSDMTQGIALVVRGSIELTRIKLSRMIWKRDIIRQPPCRRTVFHGIH